MNITIQLIPLLPDNRVAVVLEFSRIPTYPPVLHSSGLALSQNRINLNPDE